MTEKEFERVMKAQGWSDSEIVERLKEYRQSLNNTDILPLPLEMWVQERVCVNGYPKGQHYVGIPLL